MAAVPDGTLADRLAAAQTALSRAAERGITGFTDAAGHHWDVASYAEMVTRTGTSDLIDEELTAHLTGDGLDLVLIWSAWAESACPKCRPWLGKIVSLTGHTRTGARVSVTGLGGRRITGTVAGTVEEARLAGWRHPQCRCSMTGLSDGADLSGLDITPETPAQAAQRHGAARRDAYRQHEKHRAARLAMASLTPHQKARARARLAGLRRSH